MFRYYTKILARTRWKSFKGGLVSHPLWKVPCWLVSGKPRSSSHVHLAAGDNSSAREGSTMGKRPQFSHNGTVTVTRKKHRQRAKHATPSSGTGCEWRGRGCCASAHRAGAGAGPGPALPEAARTRRPRPREGTAVWVLRRPSSTLSRGCCSRRLLS